MVTQNLRRQHRQLLDLATRLAETLDPVRLASNGHGARGILNTLTGVLTVHLAMEDGVVYPRLQQHQSAVVRDLSARYVAEMGGLKETYLGFVNRWRSAETIQNNPAAFIREARAIIEALGKRIEREDDELYPLVDGTADPRRAAG